MCFALLRETQMKCLNAIFTEAKFTEFPVGINKSILILKMGIYFFLVSFNPSNLREDKQVIMWC